MGQPYGFNDLTLEEVEALKNLIHKFILPSVLDLPRHEGRFTVDTDAGQKQVAYVLLKGQKKDPAEPVGYLSQTLIPTERAYDTTHRESHSVVWAALLLRFYLKGTKFGVWTDHHALKWILKLADATEKLAR